VPESPPGAALSRNGNRVKADTHSGVCERPAVVAMIVVWVMKVLADAIVDVAAMGDCLMAAAEAMDMAPIVPTALMV
jgi:hypothetical protein